MNQVKIVVFVPLTHADIVREAMGDAGGGVLGKYTHCSVTTKVTGRYRPMVGAKPFIGEVGKMEEVKEEKIEMVVDKEKAKAVIAAMKKVHPYEEVAFDIYPLLDEEEL